MARRRGKPSPAALAGLLCVLLLPRMGSMPAAAESAVAPTAQVAVRTDRNLYLDGTEAGTFSVQEACVSSNPYVQVLESTCTDEDSHATGRIRRVVLGFDAARRAEAAPANLPALETGNTVLPQQLASVTITLQARGDLRVVLTGRASPGVDPRPVAGSASSGGVVSGRSVTWERPQADPGTYEFSVRFEPGAPAGAAGSYQPEVVVELLEPAAGHLLDYAMGNYPGPASRRTSTLTMPQRVAPLSGAPRLSASDFLPAMQVGGLPWSWEVSVSADAFGHYQSKAQGPFYAAFTALRDDIAPGAFNVTIGPTIMGAYYGSAVEGKALPVLGLSDDTGITIGIVNDEDLTDSGSPVPRAGGSTLWDGDAIQFGFYVGLESVGPLRQGELPTNSNGALRVDWDGGITHAWSGNLTNIAPGVEPNYSNPRAYACAGSGLSCSLLTAVGANLPLVASGGDIDNRQGSTSIRGETVRIPYPPGERAVFAFGITAEPDKSNFEPELVVNKTGFAEFTPTIGPGGYLLESQRDGYKRDSAGAAHILVATDKIVPPAFPPSPVIISAAHVVPPGAKAMVTSIDVIHGVSRSLELGPGEWRIEATGNRLVALPLRSNPKGDAWHHRMPDRGLVGTDG